MNPNPCWGIYREGSSPSGGGDAPADDDALTLHATAAALEAHGFQVRLCAPDAIAEALAAPSPRIFSMARDPDVLHALARAEAKGAVIVNAPAAVSATANDWMEKVLRRMRVPFDPGAPGEGIVFCGVGDRFAPPSQPVWFRWDLDTVSQVGPNREAVAAAVDARTLTALALRAAGTLGLEVFGGTVAVTGLGEFCLTSINAWPGFAAHRDEAAREIAALLARRFAPRS